MKILTITYVPLLSDPRAYKIDVSLSKEHNIVTFCPSNGKQKPHNSKVKGHDVKILEYDFNSKNSILNLLLFWWAALRTILKEKPEIVLAHNYYVIFPCLIGAKICKAKSIYDSYELYIPTKRTKLSRRQSLFYFFEKRCIKSYDLVIAANYERARLMRAKFRLHTTPLPILNISSQLPNGAPVLEVLSRYPLMEEIKGKKILVYEGFISEERSVDKFIDMLKYLDNNYVLLYIGDGPDRAKVEEYSKKLNMDKRCYFMGNIPMLDLSSLLSLCSCGLVSYPFTDLNNKYCSPNKIFEYPGAGIAMISSNQPTIRAMVSGYNIAAFVDYNKPKEAAKTVQEFISQLDSDQLRIEIKDFLDDYSWEKEGDKLLSAVAAMV